MMEVFARDISLAPRYYLLWSVYFQCRLVSSSLYFGGSHMFLLKQVIDFFPFPLHDCSSDVSPGSESLRAPVDSARFYCYFCGFVDLLIPLMSMCPTTQRISTTVPNSASCWVFTMKCYTSHLTSLGAVCCNGLIAACEANRIWILDHYVVVDSEVFFRPALLFLRVMLNASPMT